MSLLFIVIWVVVGYVALRWAGRFYFTERRRSDVFALAVVAAFTVGTLWPFSDRQVAAPGPVPVVPAAAPSAAAPPVAAAPAAAPVVAAINVSAQCKKVVAVASTTPGGLGNLDVIGETVAGVPAARQTGFTLSRTGTLVLEGWAADAAKKKPGLAACMMIDGKIARQAIAKYGISRPDVGTAYHTDAMNGTGFLLTLDAKTLKPGNHAIGVAVVTPSGATALVSKGTVVVQ